MVWLLSCILFLCFSSSNGTVGNETDRLALLAFKSSVSYDPYQVFTQWNDSFHFCEWVGITCVYGHRRVEELDLQGNFITGIIDPSIGNLSFLRILQLQENHFYGEIASLSSLSNLKTLDVSGNYLSGKIPSKLAKLERLNLAFNSFSGEVPSEGIFQNASAFSVFGNSNLCGGIPDLELPSCNTTAHNTTATQLLTIPDLKQQALGRRHTLKVVLGVLIPSFFLGVLLVIYYMKKLKSKSPSRRHLEGLKKDGGEGDNFDLPLYDLLTIKNATNNFSERNKLGQGGFGPVYKGNLEGGQEIAVKSLAKNSTQGVEEFRIEVLFISKLQHKNLIKLLGYCIQGEEKFLVYEYMQNQSLDIHIFNTASCRLLNWQKRFDIVLGIARGLLYLHHDSRLRIIHRDLKASNILLDCDMNPKIADFGLARNFGVDQIDAETTRVVGTLGYMSPEYMFDGRFSVKSDVFSFGVLVLEIISGKKNRSLHDSNLGLNLLGHTWRLWKDGRSMDMIDNELMRNSCNVEAILRCTQIGLLCVQKCIDDRPTMTSVVLMLSSESSVLPTPQHPGFYVEDSPGAIMEPRTSNNVTLTNLEGR